MSTSFVQLNIKCFSMMLNMTQHSFSIIVDAPIFVTALVTSAGRDRFLDSGSLPVAGNVRFNIVYFGLYGRYLESRSCACRGCAVGGGWAGHGLNCAGSTLKLILYICSFHMAIYPMTIESPFEKIHGLF
jgi:hypothetical protein